MHIPLFLLELAVQRHHHHHHHHHQQQQQQQNQNKILHRWERAPPTWENNCGKNISQIASTLQLSFLKLELETLQKKHVLYKTCSKVATSSWGTTHLKNIPKIVILKNGGWAAGLALRSTQGPIGIALCSKEVD